MRGVGVLVAGVGCLTLWGCGRVPDLPSRETVSVPDLQEHIRCVLKASTQSIMSRSDNWLKDWAVEATLSLTTERNGTIGAAQNTNWNIPLDTGNFLGIGPNGSVQRTDKRLASVTVHYFFADLDLGRLQGSHCSDSGETLFEKKKFVGDLGLPAWLEQVDAGKAKDLSNKIIDKFSQQITFTTKVSGAIGASVPFTNVLLVTNLSGDNSDIYDLAINFSYNSPKAGSGRLSDQARNNFTTLRLQQLLPQAQRR